MRACFEPGCVAKHYAKNLCQRHYMRLYMRGYMQARHEARPEVRAKVLENSRKWRSENKDKVRSYRDANRVSFRAMWAASRARARSATPEWLTKEQRLQIRAVYAEAERLTLETGTPHEVDHIVPLQGKTVCGLHVPWNLRAIPAVQNNRRPRIWRGDAEVRDYSLGSF